MLATKTKTDGVLKHVRKALESAGADLAKCIKGIDRTVRAQAHGGYIPPKSLVVAGTRLELEAYLAQVGHVMWSVWVDVGEGDIDQAARHYHWCAKSDDLTTYRMVSLVKAIRAHESHEV